LNPAFPLTVGYLEGKTKENLHDSGKKKHNQLKMYISSLQRMVIFQHFPAMLAKPPEGGGSSFPSQAGRR